MISLMTMNALIFVAHIVVSAVPSFNILKITTQLETKRVLNGIRIPTIDFLRRTVEVK